MARLQHAGTRISGQAAAVFSTQQPTNSRRCDLKIKPSTICGTTAFGGGAMVGSKQQAGPHRSADGCIRLTYTELQEQELVHQLSGLDECLPVAGEAHTMLTQISGYTEWIGTQQPVLSIGWDWHYDAASPCVAMRQLGEARSNILLLDAGRRDLASADSARLLLVFIDTLAWQAAVAGHIALRYRHHLPISPGRNYEVS
jgi:hypothetical protein